jgi:hypothetical protein
MSGGGQITGKRSTWPAKLTSDHSPFRLSHASNYFVNGRAAASGFLAESNPVLPSAPTYPALTAFAESRLPLHACGWNARAKNANPIMQIHPKK